jgi:hypothetical protein
MLALSELTPYLLDRRHIGPEAVVDGGLSIVDESRRNHNVLVRTDSGVGLFVKQGRSDPVRSQPNRTGGGTLTHEVAVYQLLQTLPARRGGISEAVPRCHAYDADHGLLILESVPDAQDLLTFHLRRGRFPTTVARRIGTVLADLHQAQAPDFTGRLPWVLGVDRPGTQFWREMSNAGVELVRIVQASPAMREALAQLRADWRDDAFVHHDMKWDNWLLVPAGSRPRLVLVDWEFADRGDAAWDTGSVFGSYLSCWLGSIPVTATESPDAYLDLAAFPLARMQPAMRAFWTAYTGARGWDRASADANLLRSARFAGARLLQTAYEKAQNAARVSAAVVCLTQLAENILTRPDEAVEHLLGGWA